MKVDVICPVYFADPNYFESNVRSWFKSINISALLIDCNSARFDYFNLKHYPEIINYHTKTKTLGYKIWQLAQHVLTEWFVYLHDDVLLFDTSWFIKMMAWKGDADFIESPKINVPAQWKRERPYSGAQLIRTEIFKKIKIDDDFIYVNEDIIFKHLAEKLGYRYKRVPVYHYHQLRGKRSMSRIDLLTMQQKAEVKYLS